MDGMDGMDGAKYVFVLNIMHLVQKRHRLHVLDIHFYTDEIILCSELSYIKTTPFKPPYLKPSKKGFDVDRFGGVPS